MSCGDASRGVQEQNAIAIGVDHAGLRETRCRRAKDPWGSDDILRVREVWLHTVRRSRVVVYQGPWSQDRLVVSVRVGESDSEVLVLPHRITTIWSSVPCHFVVETGHTHAIQQSKLKGGVEVHFGH